MTVHSAIMYILPLAKFMDLAHLEDIQTVFFLPVNKLLKDNGIHWQKKIRIDI